MLSLTSTLRAAQQSQDVVPVVSALVSDNPPEVARLSELASQYSGSEPDAAFDACWIPAGTFPAKIARAYLSGGSLYVQVVDPAAPSWSTWTVLDAAAGNWAGTSQVALRGWQDGTGGANCYWVAADGHTIRWAYFNVSGWTVVGTLLDAGIGNLVGSVVSSGLDTVTSRVFYLVVGNGIFETHWTGAAWSAPVSDGHFPTGSGLAGDFLAASAPGGTGDWYLVYVTGTPTTLQLERFNVTSTPAGWVAGTTTLLSAGVGTGYSQGYPKLSEARASCLRSVLSWSEVAPSPIGTQAMISFTPTHSLVPGVVPWRYAATHGVRVFCDAAASPSWWVITSNQVYRCPADAAATVGKRFAIPQSQIVEARIDVAALNHPGRGELVILNDGGVLRDAGVAGTAHQCLRAWSQVCISLGYHSSAGDEVVRQIPLWIESVTFHDEVGSGQGLVTLNLIDVWGLLEVIRARESVTYTGQTVDFILQRILWHVCGVLTATGNVRLQGLTLASFTIRAGETLGAVARRLCSLAGVVLVFRRLPASVDGTGWDSVGVSTINWGTGSSIYSYGSGAAQHPLLQSEFEPIAAPSATGVEVQGLTTSSFVRNWGHTWLLWRDNRESVGDKTLGTQAMTDLVAGYVAAELVPEQASGSILTMGHVGLEIGDQVDLTIGSAPVTAMVCAVSGFLTTWAQADGRILQTVHLQGSN